MFLFIIYSVVSLILLHFILYYFNIDYLNILKNKSENTKVRIHIEEDTKQKLIDELETSQQTLEESLNELKQMMTL